MIEVQVGGRNVNERGVLKVGPEKPSTAVAQAMDSINTAYNFFLPRPGQQFIITGAVINTDKDVGQDGSDIIIYEASSLTTTTVDKVIYEVQMLKQTILQITEAHVEVAEGKWLNAKHDDDDVFMTISGYYIDV